MGEYNGEKSPISTPVSMNYFNLSLKSGENFYYKIPQAHKVAWAFVYSGKCTLNKVETFQEVAIFGASGDGIEIKATTRQKVEKTVGLLQFRLAGVNRFWGIITPKFGPICPDFRANTCEGSPGRYYDGM